MEVMGGSWIPRNEGDSQGKEGKESRGDIVI